jgi:hypothetical protein
MSVSVVTLNEPHYGQAAVLREAKRFNVLCCGRRWGKSALSVNLLCEPAIDGYPVGYFTPTYKLLDGTYRECVAALEPIIARKNEHQFIELITGGKIEFWTLDNKLAGRSRKYKRAIVDEAAFVGHLFELWTESIRATLADMEGDAWFLSTPRGKNAFFQMYGWGLDPQRAEWMSWQKSTYTNPYINPLEIDAAKADLPELAFKQEYLAEFGENLANPFGHVFIEQCTYPMSDRPAVCFGIDLAKSFDFTVIIGLDAAGQVCYFDRFQLDWHGTKAKIRELPNKPKLIDSTGVGDPIVEEMQREGLDVDGFKFTASSKQQLMVGLVTAVQQRKITFPKGPIVDEMLTFEYFYSVQGVKYSAPAGFHDDCVIGLALAWKKYLDGGAGFLYSCA